MEDKRKRTTNFTPDEKSVLTELVGKYKELIENKKSDATTNAEKARGWKLLAEKFNSLSPYCARTPESLKTCWENIKRQSKKQSATRKREIFKTGGGRPPPPPPSTGAERMIEDILGPALEGLENQYDSDALLDDKEKANTEDYTQGCSTEISSENIYSEYTVVVNSEPPCSVGTSLQNKKQENEQHNSPSVNTSQVHEEKDNNLKWEGWTPNSLKRPLSEVLRTGNTRNDNKENNSWLKRRRPDQQNLSDQLLQEKINLVKTLIDNAGQESAKRMLILDEQLKQEKIKTQNCYKKIHFITILVLLFFLVFILFADSSRAFSCLTK